MDRVKFCSNVTKLIDIAFIKRKVHDPQHSYKKKKKKIIIVNTVMCLNGPWQSLMKSQVFIFYFLF